MGYVDSDTHVREVVETWSYCDATERQYAPILVEGRWQVGSTPTRWGPFNPDVTPEGYHELFPRGSVDLCDARARIRRMDELGVDVQIIFTTFFLSTDIDDPVAEAALMRSWNRWMADKTAGANGRLRWIVEVPFRLSDRAVEELEFGKRHGAVGVHMRGFRYGCGVADPIFTPIYERAQDLDLVMALHTGGDSRITDRDPSLGLYNTLGPVPGGCYSVIVSDLCGRYPHLRWAFEEAGASWLPFVIQEALRCEGSTRVRGFTDWRARISDIFVSGNLFIACQVDDDLPYLLDFTGNNVFVHGTDYGHLDVGSDPYGLQTIAQLDDVSRSARAEIVNHNARRLWGIDPSFTPAPVVEGVTIPELESIPDWLYGRESKLGVKDAVDGS